MQNFATIGAPVVVVVFLPLFCAVFRGDGFPVHTSRKPPHGHKRTPHTYTHVHRCTHATPSVNF